MAATSWNLFGSSTSTPARDRSQGSSAINRVTIDEDGNQIVNPYRLFQIRRDATKAEIRQAYRRMALFYHPGRTTGAAVADMSEREKEGRKKLFVILAACCETLLERESRARLDNLLKEPRRPLSSTSNPATPRTASSATFPSAIITSAKPGIRHSRREAFRQSNHADMPLPLLSHTYSSGTDDDDDEDGGNENQPANINHGSWFGLAFWESSQKTMNINSQNKCSRNFQSHQSRGLRCSSSDDMEEDHIHYTKEETDRLFGGPLALLYRARSYRVFSDPFVVFERNFGSAAFPSSLLSDDIFAMPDEAAAPQEEKNDKRNRATINSQNNDPCKSATSLASRSSAWSGTCETLPDGSIVNTTSRVFGNRKLTKQERITLDPTTGKKISNITVMSEVIGKYDEIIDAGKDEEGRGMSITDEHDDVDSGYWACCSPMLAFSTAMPDTCFG